MGFWKDGLPEHRMSMREDRIAAKEREKRERERDKRAARGKKGPPLVTKKKVMATGDAFFDVLGVGPGNVKRRGKGPGGRRG